VLRVRLVTNGPSAGLQDVGPLPPQGMTLKMQPGMTSGGAGMTLETQLGTHWRRGHNTEDAVGDDAGDAGMVLKTRSVHLGAGCLSQSWENSPDLPPALWVTRSPSIRIDRSTDLHMS
jgi:hypothetical protein